MHAKASEEERRSHMYDGVRELVFIPRTERLETVVDSEEDEGQLPPPQFQAQPTVVFEDDSNDVCIIAATPTEPRPTSSDTPSMFSQVGDCLQET